MIKMVLVIDSYKNDFNLISGEKSYQKKKKICVVNNNYFIHLTYASHQI